MGKEATTGAASIEVRTIRKLQIRLIPFLFALYVIAPETQRGEVVEVSDEATEQTVRASGTVNAEILKAAVAFKNASGWKA